MNLNITGKVIDTRPIQDLLRQGEKGVDTVTMIADRYYGDNNIDLGSLSWEIWGSYSDQDATATLPVAFTYDDDKINFSVTLDEYFTIYAGAESLTLVGSDTNGTQVLKLTGSVAIIVQENERKTSSILVPSQVSNIEQAVADCLNAAQTASASASQAAIDAATASAAAAQVTTLTDRLTAVENGKVAKSGDTMTGNLVVPTINGTTIPTNDTLVTAKKAITLSGTDSAINTASAYVVGGMVWFVAYVTLSTITAAGWTGLMPLGLPDAYKNQAYVPLNIACDNSGVKSSHFKALLWNGSYKGCVRILTDAGYGTWSGSVVVSGCWPLGV